MIDPFFVQYVQEENENNDRSSSSNDQIYPEYEKDQRSSGNSYREKSSFSVGENGSIEEKYLNISDIVEAENVVDYYLESIALQNSALIVLTKHKALLRKDHMKMEEKVKILTGGASGLEPLHSGFIGPGMVTAAIFGELTSSPSYLSILATLRVLSENHTPGVLVIVMNNTANRLNFGLACQQAAHEGIKTMCLTVGEDCSGVSVDKHIGRQGLCGIMFLMKIAGAMSEEKRSLYELFCVLTALKNKSLGTVTATLNQNLLTIGAGLKGEPGKIITRIDSISQIINSTLFYIFQPASLYSLHIVKDDNIAVIVNNLGELLDLHFELLVREVLIQISVLGINVLRVYSGRFLRSKAASGFSVSIIKVKENVMKWLDYQVNTTCWPNRANEPFKDLCLLDAKHTVPILKTDSQIIHGENIGPRFTPDQVTKLVNVLYRITNTINDMEEHLNKLDFDNDYGTTLKKYMFNIRESMDLKILTIISPFGLLNDLAEMAAATMGGVSGAVFSVLFSSAAQLVTDRDSSQPPQMNRLAGVYGLMQPGGLETDFVHTLTPSLATGPVLILFTLLCKHLQHLQWAV